jgi:hypothetical protein
MAPFSLSLEMAVPGTGHAQLSVVALATASKQALQKEPFVIMEN